MPLTTRFFQGTTPTTSCAFSMPNSSSTHSSDRRDGSAKDNRPVSPPRPALLWGPDRELTLAVPNRSPPPFLPSPNCDAESARKLHATQTIGGPAAANRTEKNDWYFHPARALVRQLESLRHDNRALKRYWSEKNSFADYGCVVYNQNF